MNAAATPEIGSGNCNETESVIDTMFANPCHALARTPTGGSPLILSSTEESPLIPPHPQQCTAWSVEEERQFRGDFVYDLDWTNWALLRQMKPYLTSATRRGRLTAIETRLKVLSRQFHWRGHRERNCILAMADTTKSDAVNRCCLMNGKSRRQTCNEWKFCGYCCSRKQAATLDAMLVSFVAGELWSITISFDGFLRLDTFFHEELMVYWEACRHVIWGLVRKGVFLGAYLVEECAPLAFVEGCPSIGHIHVVVHARCFDQAIADRIVQEVYDYFWPDVRLARNDIVLHQVSLRPVLECRPIEDIFAFGRALQYLEKVVPIVDAYRAGLDLFNAPVWKVNQACDAFLNEFLVQVAHRKQIRTIGTLHANHNATMRLPVEKRGERKREVEQVKESIIEERRVSKGTLRQGGVRLRAMLEPIQSASFDVRPPVAGTVSLRGRPELKKLAKRLDAQRAGVCMRQENIEGVVEEADWDY